MVVEQIDQGIQVRPQGFCLLRADSRWEMRPERMKIAKCQLLHSLDDLPVPKVSLACIQGHSNFD